MMMPKLLDYSIELGPIRPPSEAFSLLIRATRNCPWNRCQFCSTYKGQKFELRPVQDILKDIETAGAIRDEIKEFAWKTGDGSRIREIAGSFYNQYQHNAAIRNVALWMYAGSQSAFLQDGNTLIMRTPELIQVISFLKKTFPELRRITCYARSKTAAKKSIEELKEIKEAGLSRIHIGMESGSDVVLDYIQKGVTAEEHIRGGKNIKEAGISLSEYIIPGLGGRKMSAEHVAGTARVLNEIDPDFVRIRSLFVTPAMPLWLKIEQGDFLMQTDDEIVEELGDIIEKLDVTSEVKSDHIMNLLPEVEGKFPEAKSTCLDVISRYLSLPPEDKLNYRLGRRAGYYDTLDDLNNGSKRQRIEETIEAINAEPGGSVEEVISRLKLGFN